MHGDTLASLLCRGWTLAGRRSNKGTCRQRGGLGRGDGLSVGPGGMSLWFMTDDDYVYLIIILMMERP